VSNQLLKGLKNTAEMVISTVRAAVFLDGRFWRGYPQLHRSIAVTSAGYGADKVSDNRSRDLDTDRRLKDASWTLVNIWERGAPEEDATRVQKVVLGRHGRTLGRAASELAPWPVN